MGRVRRLDLGELGAAIRAWRERVSSADATAWFAAEAAVAEAIHARGLHRAHEQFLRELADLFVHERPWFTRERPGPAIGVTEPSARYTVTLVTIALLTSPYLRPEQLDLLYSPFEPFIPHRDLLDASQAARAMARTSAAGIHPRVHLDSCPPTPPGIPRAVETVAHDQAALRAAEQGRDPQVDGSASYRRSAAAYADRVAKAVRNRMRLREEMIAFGAYLYASGVQSERIVPCVHLATEAALASLPRTDASIARTDVMTWAIEGYYSPSRASRDAPGE